MSEQIDNAVGNTVSNTVNGETKQAAIDKSMERVNKALATNIQYDEIKFSAPDVKGDGINLFHDATMAIPAIDEENATEEQLKSHQDLIDKRQKAQSMLDLYRYNMGYKDFGEIQKEIEDVNREWGDVYNRNTITKDKILHYKSQQIYNKIQQITQENGTLPENLLRSRQFYENVDVNTFAFYSGLYSSQKKGFVDKVSQASDYADYTRALDLRFEQGEIDNTTYNKERARLQMLYESGADDSVTSVTTQVLQNMWGVYRDNKAYTIGTLLLGSALSRVPIVGPVLGGAVAGSAFAIDTYQRSQAEILSQAYQSGVNKSRDEILQEGQGYSLGAGALDALSSAITVASFGLLAPLKGLTTKMLSKAFSQSGAQAVAKQVTGGWSNEVLKTGGLVVGDTVLEATTEGAQSALTTGGVEKVTGIEQDLAKAFGDDFVSALAPSAVIATVLGSAKLAGRALVHKASQDEMQENATNAMRRVTAGATPLNERDTKTNADLVNQIVPSKIYVDPSTLTEEIKNANIPSENIPQSLQDKINSAKNGENIELSTGDYASLSNELKEVIAPLATDLDGRPMPKDVRNDLTPKQVRALRQELQQEINNNYEQAQEELNLANTISNDIYKASPNTKVEQNNAVGRLTASFLRAMSKTTGIDINELYKTFKLSYQKKNVANFTSKKGVVDSNEVAGTYDSTTKTVTLKENSDFSTVFHETSHYFLDVMRTLANEHAEIKEQLQALAKWAGVNKDVMELSNKEFSDLSEKFVAGFILSALQGRVSKIAPFGRFKNFLSSLRNTTMYSGLQRSLAERREQNQDVDVQQEKQNRVKKGFEKAYKTTLPDINQDFTSFIDSIFASDVLSEIQNENYPLDNVLNQVDTFNIPDSVKARLKDELTNILNVQGKDIDGALETITIQQALLNMIRNNDVKGIMNTVLKNLSPELKKDTTIQNYIKKVIKSADVYQDEVLKQSRRLAKSPVNMFIQHVKELSINYLTTQDLPEGLFKTLEEKGFLSANGVGVEDILNNVSIPKEIRQMLSTARGDKGTVLLNFIAQFPSVREQAEALALEKIKNSFDNESARALTNLNKAVARTHKEKAKAILKVIDPKFALDEKNGKTITNDLEALAEIDVMQTPMMRLQPSRLNGLANKENRTGVKSLVLGKIKDAVMHFRNEYYQNHKSEYASELVATVEKNLTALKNFLTHGDQKYKATHYDMDIIEVLKIVMQRVGLSESHSRYSLDELREIIENKPEYAENKEQLDSLLKLMDALENDKKFTTYYRNQNMEDVIELTATLKEIKGIANDLKYMTVGQEKVNKEQQVQEALDTLADLKDKVKPLVDEQGRGMTNTATTLADKAKSMWRSFRGQTRQVEQLTKILDGVNVDENKNQMGGFFWRNIYKPIRDAVTDFKQVYGDKLNDLKKSITKVHANNNMVECPEFILKDGSIWTLGLGKFKNMASLEVMGILLHYGVNRNKFLNGYLKDIEGVSQEKQIEEKEKCFERWIQHMVATGHITKDLLAFVQKVWDINEEVGKKVNMASRLIRGFSFKKQQTRNFSVEINGEIITMRGGYIPALRNKERTGNQEFANERDLLNPAELANAMPFTNPSFLQDKNEALPAMLELDPTVLISQLRDTLRYAYVMPAVTQVHRLLRNKQIADMLDRKAPYTKEIINNWLISCASMSNTVKGGKYTGLLGDIVQRSSMVVMCMNLNNALQQVSNLPTLLLRAGPTNLLKGLVSVIWNPQQWEKINQESKFMAVRIKEKNDGINEIFNQFLFQSSNFDSKVMKLKAGYKNVQKGLVEHTYFFQKVLQNGLDRVGYMAAKMQALDRGLSEKEAIAYAESAVREVFTSFDITDTTQIQKSTPLIKAITMFGGYFYAMFNLAEGEISRAFRQYGITDYRRYSHSMLGIWLALVVPAMIAELMQHVVGEGAGFEDDDDLDLFRTRMLLSPFKMTASAFPFIGKYANLELDRIAGKEFYSSAMLSSPLFTQIDSFKNAFENALDPNKELKGREWRAMMNGLGIIFKVPQLGAFGRPTSVAVDEGRGVVRERDELQRVRSYVVGNIDTVSRKPNF